jgi:hypothetical protein
MSNNTGKDNSGNRNSGDYNSGDYNSGNCNSGDCNSGYRNSGNHNSGNYNSGDYNSGWFNTNEPKIRFFNKDSDYTYTEFNKKFSFVYPNIKTTYWCGEDKMTKEEKSKIDGWEEMGGYLKTMSYQEAWKEYWDKASDYDKKWFQNLPNFDPNIFLEITGIDVKDKTGTKKKELIDKAEELKVKAQELLDQANKL